MCAFYNAVEFVIAEGEDEDGYYGEFCIVVEDAGWWHDCGGLGWVERVG
jgi:hypothetical protein